MQKKIMNIFIVEKVYYYHIIKVIHQTIQIRIFLKKNPATQNDMKYYISLLNKKESLSLVPYAFNFCLGSRIILLKNIDVSSGLVNGRIACVHMLDAYTRYFC